MSRREARRHAFKLIFQIPFHTGYDAETLAEAYTDYLAELDPDAGEEPPDAADTAYMIRVTGSVLDILPKLDKIIGGHLRGWRLNRLNRADLAALRLGVYELLYEKDIPVGAAVNEAVELAKRYGTDDSAAFVNALLDKVAKTARTEGDAP